MPPATTATVHSAAPQSPLPPEALQPPIACDSDRGPWQFHLAADGWPSGCVAWGRRRSPSLPPGWSCWQTSGRQGVAAETVSILSKATELALATDHSSDSHKVWTGQSSGIAHAAGASPGARCLPGWLGAASVSRCPGLAQRPAARVLALSQEAGTAFPRTGAGAASSQN